MTTVGLVLVLIAVGVVFAGLGALAYAGVWRSWTGRLHQNVVFGWFWLGLAVTSMGIAAALTPTPVFGLAFVFAAATAVTGGLGIWILLSGVPRWAQPRWYRVERGR